jgi:hypothetical protein
MTDFEANRGHGSAWICCRDQPALLFAHWAVFTHTDHL